MVRRLIFGECERPIDKRFLLLLKNNILRIKFWDLKLVKRTGKKWPNKKKFNE